MKNRHCDKCNTTLKKTADFCHACGAKIRKGSPASRKSKRQARANRHRQRRAIAYTVAALIGGSVLLLAALTLRPNPGQVDPAAIEVPDAHDEQGMPYPEVTRISLQEAKEKFDSGVAIIVDVRSTGEYEVEHISNAISMPLADFETRYRDLPREAEILTICT